MAVDAGQTADNISWQLLPVIQKSHACRHEIAAHGAGSIITALRAQKAVSTMRDQLCWPLHSPACDGGVYDADVDLSTQVSPHLGALHA